MVGWKYEVFDCSENYYMFFWALCIPCGYHCMQVFSAKLAEPSNKEAAFRACTLVMLLGCFGGSINRKLLRKVLRIPDNPFSDFIHVLMPCCAATQEWMQVMSIQKGDPKVTITKLKKIRS
ncbi:unnamed protein product [Blepharisma stoltei]|uniref:Uncharacterized protein n=1 Tax=Blepharisma stoltei TaxID=1481888 RepID=A0AAU9IFF9_9CILI|nr:unnamed protein product [Blepharisma stoltei]